MRVLCEGQLTYSECFRFFLHLVTFYILDSGIHLDSDMNLDGFVSFYNSTLHDCLEKHAPTTTRTISVRPRVAWFS